MRSEDLIHEEKRRLFVAGCIGWIISGLDLREPLEAGGMDLCDPMLEGCALDVVFHVAIFESSFQGDELSFLEGLGELREIPPGVDAVPLGAGLIVALVVLPALLGCDVEDDELTVVLSGFGFCILTQSADEDDFVEHGVGLRFFWLCPLSAVHACPEGVPSPSASQGEWTESVEGDPSLPGWEESTPRRGAKADSGKESVRPKGGAARGAAR